MNMGTSVKERASGRRSEAGTVLLETVLVIPLFMIMLGGIFWIGDLAVTRQQLLIADRYVAWNKGLRYDDRGQTGAGILHQLFFSDKEGIPSADHQPSVDSAEIQAVYDWSQVANGQVGMKVRMPDWVHTMINAANIQYSGAWMENATGLHGRERKGDRHVVLMRTKAEAEQGYIRNKYGVKNSGEVSTKWKDLAGEKWPYE